MKIDTAGYRAAAFENQESGDVEIMQNKEWKVMVAADVIDQSPRRGDRYAFGRDDHQIITVGEIYRFE